MAKKTPLNAPESIEHLDLLREGVTAYGAIKIRGLKIRIRPLSISEVRKMFADVSTKLKDAPEELQNRMSEEIELAKYTLILASTSDVGVNDATITEYILEKMTPGELLAIYRQYKDFEEKFNPSLEDISRERIDEMVAEVKKKGASALPELSRWDLAAIILSLVNADG